MTTGQLSSFVTIFWCSSIGKQVTDQSVILYCRTYRLLFLIVGNGDISSQISISVHLKYLYIRGNFSVLLLSYGWKNYTNLLGVECVFGLLRWDWKHISGRFLDGKKIAGEKWDEIRMTKKKIILDDKCDQVFNYAVIKLAIIQQTFIEYFPSVWTQLFYFFR